MTAPALTVFVTGSGAVTGDMLNTFASTCDTIDDLRAFVGTTGIQVYTRGTTAPNDNGQGFFYWDPNAVGPDNNSTIIIPPAAAQGGWVRLVENTAGFFYAQDTGTVNALQIALPEDLASIQIGTVIFVNPAHATTTPNPTLSINAGTPVTITSPLGAALAVGAIALGNPAQLMVGTGHSLWLLNPGGSTLGLYATAALGQLPGTATNDSAVAGNIGEYISSQLAPGSALPVTTVTPLNITSISLTAGDWDVWGNIAFVGTPASVFLISAISTTSGAVPNPTGGANAGQVLTFDISAAGGAAISCGPIRISVAVTTTVYLVGEAGFSGSTLTAFGFIGARRIR